MKKMMFSAALIMMVFACGKSGGKKNAAADGAVIFKKYCILCHGVDGKLGLNGAKDLTLSKLSEAERMVIVTNGRNTMTPFKGVLSEEEIKAVVAYTLTLK
jgi:cytochrome c6